MQSNPDSHLAAGVFFYQEPEMFQSVLLPPGAFIRAQAEVVTATYRNITIEDDQHSHFRLVVRDREGWMAWRVWNFEPDAGAGLNPYIRQYGILKETSAH